MFLIFSVSLNICKNSGSYTYQFLISIIMISYNKMQAFEKNFGTGSLY